MFEIITKGEVTEHLKKGQMAGIVHIRRDHRDKLSPYLLEYQPTDPKEDQA